MEEEEEDSRRRGSGGQEVKKIGVMNNRKQYNVEEYDSGKQNDAAEGKVDGENKSGGQRRDKDKKETEDKEKERHRKVRETLGEEIIDDEAAVGEKKGALGVALKLERREQFLQKSGYNEFMAEAVGAKF